MRKRHKAPSSWLRCRVAGGSWAQACSRACQDLKAEVQGRDWLPSPTTPAAERHAPAGCLLLAAPALHVCTSHLDGIRFLLRRLAPWHRPPRAASSPRSASKTVMRIHQLPPGCGEAEQPLFMRKPLSLRVCKLFGEAPAASPEPGASIVAVTSKANAREAGAASPAAASPRRRSLGGPRPEMMMTLTSKRLTRSRSLASSAMPLRLSAAPTHASDRLPRLSVGEPSIMCCCNSCDAPLHRKFTNAAMPLRGQVA